MAYQPILVQAVADLHEPVRHRRFHGDLPSGPQDIPEHLYEAAELDGATAWHKTHHVTLPMLTLTIFFNPVMFLTGVFSYFTQAFIYFKMGYASAMDGMDPVNRRGWPDAPGIPQLQQVSVLWRLVTWSALNARIVSPPSVSA